MWGSAFAGIRVALTVFSPGEIAFLRSAIAALVLLAACARSRIRFPRLRHLPHIIATGLTGITGYHLFLNLGEREVTAAAASFITALSPIIAACLSAALLRERPSVLAWLGLLISFLGAALIASSQPGGLRFTIGAFFVFLAALCGGVYIVLQKPLLRHYSALEVTTYAMLVGAIFLSPYGSGTPHAFTRASLHVVLAVLYLAVFPAAVAYLIWSHIIARTSVIHAATFLYLIPLAATAAGYLWLRETPSLRTLLGGALTLTGVALVNRRATDSPQRHVQRHHHGES